MKLLQNPRLGRVLLFTAVLFTAGAVLLVLALHGVRIPCVFHTVTGLSCPGCGNTRAAVALWQLDLAASFRYNPMFLPEVFYLSWVALSAAAGYLKEGRFRYRPRFPVIDIVFLAVLLLWGILRNFPGFSVP